MDSAPSIEQPVKKQASKSSQDKMNIEQNKNKYKKLEEEILIDFFLTVGIPHKLVYKILEHIKEHFEDDVSSEEAF